MQVRPASLIYKKNSINAMCTFDNWRNNSMWQVLVMHLHLICLLKNTYTRVRMHARCPKSQDQDEGRTSTGKDMQILRIFHWGLEGEGRPLKAIVIVDSPHLKWENEIPSFGIDRRTNEYECQHIDYIEKQKLVQAFYL